MYFCSNGLDVGRGRRGGEEERVRGKERGVEKETQTQAHAHAIIFISHIVLAIYPRLIPKQAK